jgi:hypothetical protein
MFYTGSRPDLYVIEHLFDIVHDTTVELQHMDSSTRQTSGSIFFSDACTLQIPDAVPKIINHDERGKTEDKEMEF